jgi:hypothetical protein
LPRSQNDEQHGVQEARHGLEDIVLDVGMAKAPPGTTEFRMNFSLQHSKMLEWQMPNNNGFTYSAIEDK